MSSILSILSELPDADSRIEAISEGIAALSDEEITAAIRSVSPERQRVISNASAAGSSQQKLAQFGLDQGRIDDLRKAHRSVYFMVAPDQESWAVVVRPLKRSEYLQITREARSYAHTVGNTAAEQQAAFQEKNFELTAKACVVWASEPEIAEYYAGFLPVAGSTISVLSGFIDQETANSLTLKL